MNDKLIIAKSEPLWNTDNRVIYFIGSLIVLLFALPQQLIQKMLLQF